MDPEILDHLLVVAAAFVVVVLATPVAKRTARAVGAVKAPGDRHIHSTATPELGGLAMFAGFLGALAVASRLGAFAEEFRTTSEPEAIVLGAAVIVAVGFVDDTRGLSAGAKLAGQIMAAGTLVLFGVTLRFVYIPFGAGSIVSLSPDVAALITIVAVVAMINAVNLVDGLDGLAAGLAAIAAGALLTYTLFVEQGAVPLELQVSSASLILAAVLGACLGFLVYNFNPASIFMGDTGAMLLGLLVSAAGVSAIGRTVQPTSTDFVVASVPVLLPVLVLAIPFVDTLLAVMRRLVSGQALFSPDKKHIHHRLLELGHSQRRAVLLLYGWSAMLAVAVVGQALLPGRTVVVIVATSGVLLLLATVLRPGRRRGRHARAHPLRDHVSIVYDFTSERRSRGSRGHDDG